MGHTGSDPATPELVSLFNREMSIPVPLLGGTIGSHRVCFQNVPLIIEKRFHHLCVYTGRVAHVCQHPYLSANDANEIGIPFYGFLGLKGHGKPSALGATHPKDGLVSNQLLFALAPTEWAPFRHANSFSWIRVLPV